MFVWGEISEESILEAVEAGDVRPHSADSGVK